MDWKSGEREGRGGGVKPAQSWEEEGPLPALMMDSNGETRAVGIGEESGASQ